jgi:hypothetical protein
MLNKALFVNAEILKVDREQELKEFSSSLKV